MNANNILTFLTHLAANNNRDWFMENKTWYQQTRVDYEQFVAEWLEKMQPIAPELRGLQAKDCIWRIYRDLRFERNRMQPYKEWYGAWLAPYGGKNSPHAGYYLHMQPGECMFAAGIWGPDPTLLKALRRSIFDNPEELEDIMYNPAFKHFFPDFDTDYMLKTAPAGYPKDWEHVDWLKRKSYTISYRFTDAEVCAPDFMERLLQLCEVAKPLNDFLDYTFEEMAQR